MDTNHKLLKMNQQQMIILIFIIISLVVHQSCYSTQIQVFVVVPIQPLFPAIPQQQHQCLGGQFCNFDDGGPSCGLCSNIQSERDCMNSSLPTLGASDCTSVCFASTTEPKSVQSTASETILSCVDANQPYPRQMKNYMTWDNELVGSYICCDLIINNNGKHTTNFLNITECVPYQDKNFELTAQLKRFKGNRYGSIIPITAYCKNSEDSFQYISETYERCKPKQRRYPFVQDRPFMVTVYPMPVLSTIAVIICTILIVSLLIPLWLHWRVKQAIVNVPVSTTRATYRRLKEAAAASSYSSYYLYLVFLAISDCVLNLYFLGMYGSYTNQQYNSNFVGEIIIENFDDYYCCSEHAFGTFRNSSLRHYHPWISHL